MKKALLIVDVQNDFLPGGSLAIKGADQIIPNINRLQKVPFDLIIASKDWHPEDHCSFKIWPPHCIQNSLGAEFPKKLSTKKINKIIYKGTDPNIDSYSAFFDNGHIHSTELDQYLKENQILELVLAGIATDYCVKQTALDGIDLGYTVILALDACKSMDDELKAVTELSEKGVRIRTVSEIF